MSVNDKLKTILERESYEMINEVNKKLNKDDVFKAINKVVGPSSSNRMTDEIIKLKKQDFKSIEKIISNSWGPNITSKIMKNIKFIL